MEFVEQVKFVQWNTKCPIDQSILNKHNILVYICSLEWLDEHHTVLKECNDLFAVFGRKLVIRRSTKYESLTLYCCHSNEYRSAKLPKNSTSASNPDSAIVSPSTCDDEPSKPRQTTSGRVGCQFS